MHLETEMLGEFEVVTSVSLWSLVKHASQWLINLGRAGDKRKKESIHALRSVVRATRKTSVYLRQLRDTGQRDHKAEENISMQWTDLGFALQDLKLNELAKRCEIKGKYWADPESMVGETLEKADIGFEKMEQLAQDLLDEIGVQN